MASTLRLPLIVALSLLPAFSQTRLPKTGRTPVVLLNGYQLICSNSIPSSNNFGNLETLLREDGIPVAFYNNCTAGRLPIEILGQRFGEWLDQLQYEDGSPVDKVDAVTHSMGGLIVRAYLSGKRDGVGIFLPPPVHKIRKLAMIASPNFGVDLPITVDVQSAEQLLGSQFLFDMATWNQGLDNLREVDAISILGTAGSLGQSGATDGLIGVTSAAATSFYGYAEERTRVLPYCHIDSILVTCRNGAPFLAKVDTRMHATYTIVSAFLKDDPAWRSIGVTPSKDPFLSKFGGLLLGFRNNANVPLTSIQSVTVSDPTVRLARSDAGLFGNQFVPPAPLTVQAAGDATQQIKLAPGAGIYTAAVAKPGVLIARVTPAFGPVPSLHASPRMIVSIYGQELATATEQAQALPLPEKLGGATVRVAGRAVGLTYASPGQINAVLPEDATGLVTLIVSTDRSQHAVNLLIEPAVPALFTSAVRPSDYSLITPAAPAHAGEILVLFATGLGRGDQLVTANVNGQPAKVLYGGPAPVYPGLDQINLELPQNLSPAPSIPLTVTVNGRVSNTILISVQ